MAMVVGNRAAGGRVYHACCHIHMYQVHVHRRQEIRRGRTNNDIDACTQLLLAPVITMTPKHASLVIPLPIKML